jgi:hypothetical protein
MRRHGHTGRTHGRGARPWHVFQGRDRGGTLLPPVRSQIILRWSARASSALVLGFLGAFLVGAGLDTGALRGLDWLLMALLALMGVGLLLGWRWEGWGGALALVALGAFFLVEWSTSGSWPGGWAFPSLALPGVLFVASRLVGARAARQHRPLP